MAISARAIDLAPGEVARLDEAHSCNTSVEGHPILPPGDEAACDSDGMWMIAGADSTKIDFVVGGVFYAPPVARSWLTYRFTITSDDPAYTGDLVPLWLDWQADWSGKVSLLGLNEPNAAAASLRWRLEDLANGQVTHSGTVFDHGTEEMYVSDPTGTLPAGLSVDVANRLAATNRRGSLAAVVRRGREYRLTFELICYTDATLFDFFGLAETKCRFYDDLLGPGVGYDTKKGVKIDFVRLRAGLDPSEVSARLESFAGIEEQLAALRTRVEELERSVEALEGHTHVYLTGRGNGHNNTEAETSTPDLPPEEPEPPGSSVGSGDGSGGEGAVEEGDHPSSPPAETGSARIGPGSPPSSITPACGLGAEVALPLVLLSYGRRRGTRPVA